VEVYFWSLKRKRREKEKKEKALKATCDQSKEYLRVKDQEVFNEMASWPALVKKR